MPLEVLKATICLLKKEGKTLFIDYRNYNHPLHKGFYSPPGGKIEHLETKEEGAIREIFEETNIKVNKVIYRGKVFFNNEKRLFGGKPSKYSFLVYYFEAFDFDNSSERASEGELAWTVDNEIERLNMQKGDLQIMNWLKLHREIDAEIMQDENGNIEGKLISFLD